MLGWGPAEFKEIVGRKGNSGDTMLISAGPLRWRGAGVWLMLLGGLAYETEE